MKKMLFAVCAFTFALGAAEICLELNNPADWKNSKIVKKGNECTVFYSVPQISAEAFPVAKDKTYTISGEFRAVAANANAKLLLGFCPVTAEGKVINAGNVMVANAQLGELAEAVAPGATQIKVKNAASWKINSTIFRLAFNAQADRSDLPNYALSPNLVPGNLTADANGVVTLTFKAPLKESYPAGTKIRLHRAGDLYIFVGLHHNPKALTTSWQKFSGKISFKGGPGFQVWYPGTAKAYAALLPIAGGKVEVRDFQVTEE